MFVVELMAGIAAGLAEALVLVSARRVRFLYALIIMGCTIALFEAVIPLQSLKVGLLVGMPVGFLIASTVTRAKTDEFVE